MTFATNRENWITNRIKLAIYTVFWDGKLFTTAFPILATILSVGLILPFSILAMVDLLRLAFPTKSHWLSPTFLRSAVTAPAASN